MNELNAPSIEQIVIFRKNNVQIVEEEEDEEVNRKSAS